MNESLPNQTENSDPVDLDWLAFQYVSDELSAEDAAAFETMLDDQQAAREALAGAVQLLAGLNQLAPENAEAPLTVPTAEMEHSLTRPALSRTQQWSLVSFAALLLIAVTFLLNRPVPHKTTIPALAQTEPSQEDLEHVLDLWSESAENSSITVDLTPDVEPIDFLDQPHTLAENQSIEIPDWLYTAVSLPEESVN